VNRDKANFGYEDGYEDTRSKNPVSYLRIPKVRIRFVSIVTQFNSKVIDEEIDAIAVQGPNPTF
jgi:hypothetical protein